MSFSAKFLKVNNEYICNKMYLDGLSVHTPSQLKLKFWREG